ncbi:MAG: TonB-dependent receptor [Bacteroidaceae bacterium]|nr:TonB-dependent receptor [Bacteroidaceae bacterium]
MKRNRLVLLVAMLPALAGMQAQTSYEAAVLLDTDLSGTARYVGMGGAMSALGAEMSTMSTNPAGTALYRSWDAALSFGGNWATQRTQTNLGRGRAFSSYGSFDNAGVVIANKQSNDDLLRFVNFGFNYRNVKRFGGKMGMASDLNGLSQTGQMAWQAYENQDVVYEDFDETDELGFFQSNYYKESWVGWLTLMGTQGYLIDGSALDNGKYYPSYNNSYKEVQSGGIDAYDFNLSFNLSDAVYLGATFTAYTVDRHIESTYTEEFADGDYTLQNFYRTNGSGYDFKLGVILRPFEESSFRFGVSATTPTVYSLCDYNSAILSSNVSLTDADGNSWIQSTTIDTQNGKAYGGDCYTEYTMIAPMKVNFSLGGTIGTSLALGAEYEYTDYATTKLYHHDGVENTEMNDHTGANFNGKHTLRLGAEKTFGTFYTRLGYNFQTGGYKKDAWKWIPLNSVQTNTAYANVKSTNNFTLGIGFRGNVFYTDMALLYSHHSADFFPFDNPQPEATSLTRSLVKGMMTVGMRF